MRAVVFAVCVVGFCADVVGDESQGDIDAFLERCEKAKPGMIAAAKARVESVKKTLAETKAGVVLPGQQIGRLGNGRRAFNSAKDKTDSLAKQESALKAAKERLAALERGELPVVNLAGNFGVGDIGRLEIGHVDLVQVVDSTNMLVTGYLGDWVGTGQYNAVGKELLNLPSLRIYWLRGFPTDGLTDDSKLDLAGRVVKVPSTTRYETALGTTSTVLVIEPFDVEQAKAAWAERHKGK